MCGICGCSDMHHHDHAHREHHALPHLHAHVHGAPPASALQDHSHETPSLARRVQIERDVYAANNLHAQRNRRQLAQTQTLALNLVSSPGSGKTTLLTRLIEKLSARLPIVVIEGDQQTDADARRIRATGVPAIQINTGKGCHLDAHMVGHALEDLPAMTGGVVFIENVGKSRLPGRFRSRRGA